MNKTVRYRFESFLYPAQVTRIELETGDADWVTIRRRHQELATTRNEQVMLYSYNDYLRQWDYLGKVMPNGDFYDFNGGGPYLLTANGKNYYKKEGGDK